MLELRGQVLTRWNYLWLKANPKFLMGSVSFEPNPLGLAHEQDIGLVRIALRNVVILQNKFSLQLISDIGWK